MVTEITVSPVFAVVVRMSVRLFVRDKPVLSVVFLWGHGGHALRIWACLQVCPHFSYTSPITCHILQASTGAVAPQVM